MYFGNWLRDYSQAVDVGTVKYVSAEAIRILLWVLGFMSFGYGSGEFEVTTQRLGCYRPEEHIESVTRFSKVDLILTTVATQKTMRTTRMLDNTIVVFVAPSMSVANSPSTHKQD